jgi:putative membrane protein
VASGQDLQFLDQAATSGVTEITEDRLAIALSPTFAVVGFAQQDLSDHTSLDTQLTSIAQSEGLPLPVAFTSPAVQSSIATQLNLFGPASDEEYLLDMLGAHRQDISNFQQEVALGQDPQLRSFAEGALPTLEAHLNAATTLLNYEYYGLV